MINSKNLVKKGKVFFLWILSWTSFRLAAMVVLFKQKDLRIVHHFACLFIYKNSGQICINGLFGNVWANFNVALKIYETWFLCGNLGAKYQNFVLDERFMLILWTPGSTMFVL